MKIIKQIYWRRISQSEIRNSAAAEKNWNRKARAGKNSFPPTPFLFARPSVQFGARSAPSILFKKGSDFVKQTHKGLPFVGKGMKIWKLNLYSHVFPYIAAGKKSVEGRAWSKKRDYRKMKPGDKIVFTDLGSKKKITATIDGVKNYKTVKKFLKKEGLKKCLPWAKSLAEGIGVYYGIAEDWEERIRHGGIFAIRMHLDK